MTSTADTAQHPDVSEISDLTEGLLPPGRTADVRRHLGGCELCADVRTSLEEIRGLLGTLPGPSRMPADVAGRIDAALAAEALLESTAPPEGPGANVSRETTGPTGEPSPAARSADRPAGRPRTDTNGPGRTRRTRGRRRAAILGTVLGVAAAGVGVLLFQPSDPAGEKSTAARPSEASTGAPAAFSGAPLDRRVRELLTETPAHENRGLKTPHRAPSEHNDTGPHVMRTEEAGLPSCVRAGTHRDTAPLAAEAGTYQGHAAYLVLLPRPGDTTRVDALVLDASCTASPDGAPARVLRTESYPRP
ncbi:hypothetical protein NX801_05905 [Streptomyces sp. LP05-1]|uniref:Zinc-finger domain-containing protein n=1 Tax=Streptomyces pyxinae TaxID=2970734 RepID=A0ABT2CCQ6_9ACTN|nr:hypothetical protein [Streptomyces sp. LP05-1]MCS0635199.1 hypothetical protein [Streptomyces sp. LP05-1]